MIRVSEPYIGGNALHYVAQVLERGWLSPGGVFAERFREMLAERFHGARITLANSGTSAIETALRAVARVTGIVGGEVVVPVYTCPDTAFAVTRAGFTPVFADIDPVRLCLTAETLRAALTRATVGVVPVHIYGMACGVEVYEAARAARVFVVDDAGGAFGATVQGVPLVDLADAVCYSLRGEKLLPIGTGGVIATRHAGIHGMATSLIGLNSCDGWQRYRTLDVSLSYEYPEILAALGCAQLEAFEESLARRWQVVQWYAESGCTHPFREGDAPWKFPLRCGQAWTVFSRLLEAGVEASPPFTPLYRLRPFAQAATLPVAETLSRELLALPLHSRLEREDVAEIVKNVGTLTRWNVRLTRGRERAALRSHARFSGLPEAPFTGREPLGRRFIAGDQGGIYVYATK